MKRRKKQNPVEREVELQCRPSRSLTNLEYWLSGCPELGLKMVGFYTSSFLSHKMGAALGRVLLWTSGSLQLRQILKELTVRGLC